jgi:uncharacterized protein YdaU (DUF1376 family)
MITLVKKRCLQRQKRVKLQIKIAFECQNDKHGDTKLKKNINLQELQNVKKKKEKKGIISLRLVNRCVKKEKEKTQSQKRIPTPLNE